MEIGPQIIENSIVVICSDMEYITHQWSLRESNRELREL